MAFVVTALVAVLCVAHSCVADRKNWDGTGTVQDKLVCEYLWPGSHSRVVAPREGNGGYIIRSALVDQFNGKYTVGHQYTCKKACMLPCYTAYVFFNVIFLFGRAVDLIGLVNPYEGFIIQARDRWNEGLILGSFIPLDTSKAQTILCHGNEHVLPTSCFGEEWLIHELSSPSLLPFPPPLLLPILSTGHSDPQNQRSCVSPKLHMAGSSHLGRVWGSGLCVSIHLMFVNVPVAMHPYVHWPHPHTHTHTHTLTNGSVVQILCDAQFPGILGKDQCLLIPRPYLCKYPQTTPPTVLMLPMCPPRRGYRLMMSLPWMPPAHLDLYVCLYPW